LKTVTIAAVQSTWEPGNVEGNLSKMLKLIKEISLRFKDIDMLCFCETALQGYDPRNWSRMAEPIPGPLTSKLSKLSAKVEKWVCLGTMIEKEGERLYNTCVLFSPTGEIALKYRKTHPWITYERIQPGNEYPVFNSEDLGKVGFMICYDGFFPEVARSLIWHGAEIIIWPSMIFHPHEEMWRTIAKARALENQCFIVGINGCGYHGGATLVGHSLFVDPTGIIISEAGGGEAVLIETLNLDIVKEVREKGTKRGNTLLKHWKELGKKYEIYNKSHSDF
jgi:formamidase